VSSIEIDVGTSSRRGRRAGTFDVSQVRFAAAERLRWHAHPRACVAVVVDGAVQKRFTRLCTEAPEAMVVSMPAEEPHEDVFGPAGAMIVVVEAEGGVSSVSCFRDWGALLLAQRIVHELAVDDAFSRLALEGLALELSAAAGRRRPVRPQPERWLQDAYEILHERFRELPTAAEIGACVGVHPSHLARCFRAHYRESLGGCVRRLRLDWAASELVRSDIPLAWRATEAGFVDQSHFTRAFKGRFGITPARYRAAHR
jgi:AraC family transcriptional regulator